MNIRRSSTEILIVQIALHNESFIAVDEGRNGHYGRSIVTQEQIQVDHFQNFVETIHAFSKENHKKCKTIFDRNF